MRKHRVLSVMMAITMLLAPIAGVAGTVGASASTTEKSSIDASTVEFQSSPSNPTGLPGNFVNATDSVDVWDRAIFTLRADRSDSANTATSVESIYTEAKAPGTGASPLQGSNNRNLVVYPNDATINLDFDVPGKTDASVSDISGEQVHLIAAKAESSEDPELPSTININSLRNFVKDEADNKNVIFENVSTQTVSGGDGSLSFTYDLTGTNRGAGAYTFMAVTTANGGIDVTNNNVSVPGNATVLGADTAIAQQTSSDVTIDETYEVGETISVDVDANIATSEDRVEHAVAIWNESAVANERLTVIAPDPITEDTPASDFTINHTIENVAGVQNVEDDVSAFGRTLNQNNRAGVFNLADIVSFVANEGEFSEPTTNRVDTTTINASMTAVNVTQADTTVDVETLDSFEPGEYVVVHMAMVDGDLTKVSSKRTDITLAEKGSTGETPGSTNPPSSGSSGGSSGSSDDDGPEPPEGTPEPPEGVSVASDVTAELVRNDDDTTTASFSEDSAVDSITFGFRASGTVNVRTLDREPDETGPAPGASAAVSQISVSDVFRNSDATIRMRISRERLESLGADPQELTAFRFVDGEWQPLNTRFVGENDESIIVEAQTPGFSYFAVSATGEPTAAIDAPSEVEPGTEVTLDASDSTTKYGEIVSYDWSVNGDRLSGETITTTLDETGDVNIELTVENDAGETNSVSTTITVAQPDGDAAADDGSSGDETDSSGSGGESSDDGIPGFGVVVAALALIAAALIARRVE